MTRVTGATKRRPRPRRKRVQASSTARGYGYDHEKLREQRIKVYRPGDRCAHGGEQMWWWPPSVAKKFLHLPHTADRSGYLPGLSCAKHNLSEAATRGNRMRGSTRRWAQSRQW